MEKEAFVSLFLERLVLALDKNIKDLKFRTTASDEQYIMVNYHNENEPPYVINVTGATNLEAALTVLMVLKEGGLK